MVLLLHLIHEEINPESLSGFEARHSASSFQKSMTLKLYNLVLFLILDTKNITVKHNNTNTSHRLKTADGRNLANFLLGVLVLLLPSSLFPLEHNTEAKITDLLRDFTRDVVGNIRNRVYEV